MADLDAVAHDVQLLGEIIARLGSRNEDGSIDVTYGVLFEDDDCQQTLESLVGTLKAARKRGVIDWKGQMLLKGTHDAVVIKLLPTSA